MKKIKLNNTHRKHILIKVLGIALLAFFILVDIAGASPFAYITNSGSDSISVIDTATDTVTGILDIGSGPLGVAVTPDGTKVYVTNSGDGTVSVIDTATNKVIKTIFDTQQAYGVAVSSDGKKAYVAGYNLYLIDTATNDVTASVGGVGYNARGVVVTPDGKKAYVTCEGLDLSNPASIVYVIDTARSRVIKKIDVGKDPIGAAVSPDGKKVYVSSRGTVSIIDTVTDKIVAVVDIGYTPYLTGIAVNPQGTTAYVANPYDKTVSVIDTIANKVTGKVPVGTEPRGVSVTPDGTKVYVANSGDGTVSVIDTSTNTVKGVIDVEVSPQAFGQFIVPSGQLVLPIANFTSDPTSGYVPLTVKFKDKSKNAMQWNWDFGDGDTSTEQNPTHTYSTAGKYTVNLIVSNGNGTNSKLATINVLDPVSPVADFSSNVTSGYVPLTVQFTDLSTNAAKWNWNFGDGSKSTEQNPVHTYYAAGKYTVKLTVTNKVNQNTKSSEINVKLGSPTYAYISNSDDNTVSVIDTATNDVIASVSVGQNPFGVAVSPDGTKAYVANYGSDTVSVIDTATNTVTATVGVGSSPYEVAVNPQGTKIYVTNSGGFQISGTVSVINTATNKVTGTILVGENPRGVAVSPDGKNVYVTNYGDSDTDSPGNTVSVIDTATNKVTATVNIGTEPEGIAVSPDGKKVYVTILRVFDYNQPDSVYVIDTATNSVTATVEAGIVPSSGIAVNPAGTKVYSTDIGNNIVCVIDTKTNKVTATVPVGSGPEGVAVTPDGKSVYVANKGDNSVSVIDTATNNVKATINVGESPIAVGKFIGSLPTFKPVIPVANFSAKPTSGAAPLTVAFTDTSTGAPTSWKWNFGDGTNSTQQNPTYKYSKIGKYTVSLTVKNAAGSNTVTKTDYITVVAKPVAAFSASLTSGKAPLTVTFTDKSTGTPTKWKWSFGDGTTSTKQNPIHKYSKAGNYKVTLTVTNAAGSNTVTKTNYIKVITKPVAAFSASPTSGKAPLTVTFTDKSTGVPTKWKWSFGDGTTSTKQNPIHKYSKAGKYTVTLTVTNAAGSNKVTKTNYVTVVAKPVAAFSASPTTGKIPLNVEFTDKSTGTPTKWKWSFGDGTTSTKQNPVYKYSKAGKYTVSLTVTNAAGINTKTVSNYITVKK